MKRIIIAIILSIIVQATYSHPWKPSHYVIIDTDGGIDDLKAICMLLASPDVRVLAIIASGGTLDASNTYLKVRSLLNRFHHEGVPAGINHNISGENYELPLSFSWGDESGITVPENSNFISVIKSAIEGESAPIKLISLGSLNTFSVLLEEEVQIGSIYWSIESLNPAAGMNFELDRESAEMVLKSSVPLIGVGYISDKELYTSDLIREIEKVNNRYANAVSTLFRWSSIKWDHSFVKKGTDEMIPFALHYPGMFESVSREKNNFFYLTDTANSASCILRLFRGETIDRNQVIKDIPTDPLFYYPDIQPYVNEIIEAHGMDEWTSGVLASELHRHLGVFAVIGVKMGIRAREYFRIGVDEMYLVSYAGSTPPLSCMNDGLQVSTGATPGHGLLTVVNDNPYPEVEFRYKDRVLRIRLKEAIATSISEELQEINYIYGLDSNIYWELVRQKSILYWKNLSRYDIFEIAEIE